jgi:hypothetical protein
LKPLTTMKSALQDIIARSFGPDAYKIRDIRLIAQQALAGHKKDIPKPNIDCPKGFIIGEDHGKYPACKRCPKHIAQVCDVYNYVWYTE